MAATCTSPGYTVKECSVCGDRHITDVTAALPHGYEAHTIPASCETGGKTIHRCDGCGSNSRCRIAGYRFQQDRPCFRMHQPSLLRDNETV